MRSHGWHETSTCFLFQGTVIRVFSVPEGQKLYEFRRGMKRCVLTVRPAVKCPRSAAVAGRQPSRERWEGRLCAASLCPEGAALCSLSS